MAHPKNRVTQHEFLLRPEVRSPYFQLLTKYYPGIKATIVIQGSCGEKNVLQGTICQDWLEKVPDSKEVLQLLTDPFPTHHATLRTLPPQDSLFFCAPPPLLKVPKKVHHLRNLLEKTFLHRVEHPKEPISQPYDIHPIPFSFGHVLTALRYVRNAALITRCLISYRYEHVVVVLQENYTFGLTTSKICDVALPSFDIEEGYAFDILSGPWVTTEWKESFYLWRSNLHEHHYETWDEPIFLPDYTWTLLVKDSHSHFREAM